MTQKLKEFVELLNKGLDSKESDQKAIELIDSFYKDFIAECGKNRTHPEINDIVMMATPEVLTAMFMAICLATLNVCSNES